MPALVHGQHPGWVGQCLGCQQGGAALEGNPTSPRAAAYQQESPLFRVQRQGVEPSLAQASAAALALFEFGQAQAAQRGLLLVDTKYEFGKDPDGLIRLIDEIHTPDSSRHALAAAGQGSCLPGQRAHAGGLISK